MTGKTTIVEALQEGALLLPELVAAALAANDRAKYYLGLLQSARRQAEAPEDTPPDLAAERRAAEVPHEELDRVVAATERIGEGEYRIPSAHAVIGWLLADVSTMIEPLRRAEEQGLGPGGGAALHARFERLQRAAPDARGDVVPGSWITAATSTAQHEGEDSLHMLLMAAHRVINELQAALARESIDGAFCYGLRDDDRSRVAAFMGGLNRTAKLKFDHPGLGTTATRSGTKLLLQNDIGTSDAHVIVIHVDARTVTVTYTDVHIQRLEFFQRMFSEYAVTWHDTRSRRLEGPESGDVFYMCIGRFIAADEDELDTFLASLGSKLVFLIDWNRARKRLRPFVRKRDALALLDWAARNELGHRGFLQLGGEKLIYEAMERAMKTPFRFGERLQDMLGRDAAIDYLRFVLRCASEGLREGKSEALLREEIRAELFNYFHTIGERLLGRLADHAALVVDLASTLRDGLMRLGLAGTRDRLLRDAARAKDWEKRADALVVDTRKLVARTAGTSVYLHLIEEADDIADGLEEAAFHLTLLPTQPDRSDDVVPPLLRLGELLFAGARELVRCVEIARHLRRGADRQDVQGFLVAVDSLANIEHETDAVERNVTAALMKAPGELRKVLLLAEVGRDLEGAADAMMRTAFILRDHVLDEVMSA